MGTNRMKMRTYITVVTVCMLKRLQITENMKYNIKVLNA